MIRQNKAILSLQDLLEAAQYDYGVEPILETYTGDRYQSYHPGQVRRNVRDYPELDANYWDYFGDPDPGFEPDTGDMEPTGYNIGGIVGTGLSLGIDALTGGLGPGLARLGYDMVTRPHDPPTRLGRMLANALDRAQYGSGWPDPEEIGINVTSADFGDPDSIGFSAFDDLASENPGPGNLGGDLGSDDDDGFDTDVDDEL